MDDHRMKTRPEDKKIYLVDATLVRNDMVIAVCRRKVTVSKALGFGLRPTGFSYEPKQARRGPLFPPFDLFSLSQELPRQVCMSFHYWQAPVDLPTEALANAQNELSGMLLLASPHIGLVKSELRRNVVGVYANEEMFKTNDDGTAQGREKRARGTYMQDDGEFWMELHLTEAERRIMKEARNLLDSRWTDVTSSLRFSFSYSLAWVIVVQAIIMCTIVEAVKRLHVSNVWLGCGVPPMWNLG
ncbi:hypothetical protein PAXINDRAFT_12432 [Paxillus involutus ATCC 200175]|uniref:Unplaced genomic scaffold PAXINscaffold_18, whole genome shotgun sequence n=1 Tax=Paxillus involutus ATCC 200175 TaxID=664439 RepID=A0A0C9U6R5_PAXIN|nr:hypothetical protein PAXINDRAFT_12432 [Paxillus involutus ATCC 200175]